MKSYKNRSIDYTKPVKIYRNLNIKSDKPVYSVKQSGLVVAHIQDAILMDCKFKVSQAGRQRVIKEQRKNVHAFICGYISNTGMASVPKLFKVIYNPYKYSEFMMYGTDINKAVNIYKADNVAVTTDGIYVF